MDRDPGFLRRLEELVAAEQVFLSVEGLNDDTNEEVEEEHRDDDDQDDEDEKLV